MSDALIVHRPSNEIGARAGPADWFSGQVWLESISARDGFPVSVLRVNFQPGGRTAWHTHPGGQILVVTSGNGLIADRKSVRRMSIGDVVEIPAGVEHWHGAAADTPMQHLAIQPGTDWLEPVNDEDYAIDAEEVS